MPMAAHVKEEFEMSNKHRGYRPEHVFVDEVSVSDEVDTVIETPVLTQTDTVKAGIVTDCLKLNIRKDPNPSAEIMATVDALTELKVYDSFKHADFYKVCTASGIEGYCMKKYVAVAVD